MYNAALAQYLITADIGSRYDLNRDLYDTALAQYIITADLGSRYDLNRDICMMRLLHNIS